VRRVERYLARLFLARWVTLLVATLILLTVLDSLGNADVLPEDATLTDNLRLMLLRLPVLFDRMVLFTLLLAVLLTYSSLVRHSELVVLAGAGLSPLQQFRAMAPAILLAGIVSVVVIDLPVPPSARRVSDWLGPEAFSDPGLRQGESLWIAEPEVFVEIGAVDGDRLSGITFFERGAEPGVLAMTTAQRAVFGNGVWVLSGVEQVRFDGSDRQPREIWATDQTPETLARLGSDPRSLSLTDLARLSSLRGTGSRPSGAYAVWALDRLSIPLVGLGLLLIAVALMQRFGRGSAGEIGVALGMLMGFCFFILDGVLKALAASGGVAVWLAIGVPILAILAAAAWLLHRCERLA